MARAPSAAPKDSTANLGFEAKLWLAADKLRNNKDAAEHKHVRFQFVVPPNGKANLAWVQHYIHYIRRSVSEGGHLAQQVMAGLILANGSIASNQSCEGDIPCAAHPNHWHN